MKLPFGIELKRDTNYYFGLTLLSISILCIVWAIVKDAFEPKDFLVYFLIYSWGYVLILKSDSELRIGNLEQRVRSLENRFKDEEPNGQQNDQPLNETTGECISPSSDDAEGTEEFQPGLQHEMNEEEPMEIFNELKGEE